MMWSRLAVLTFGIWSLLSIGSGADVLMRDGKALPSPPADEKPEVFVDPAKITALAVEPVEVRIDGRTDYAQVLVTATLTDGTQADATRLAAFDAGGLAVINPFGHLTPKADGQGPLKISVGSHAVAVPLVVSGATLTMEPDYVRDVMPVLSKSGCNAGTCHGSKEGRNGFKLSLRGYDPIFDIRALTDDLSGRRANVAFPDASLMLLKASGAVPHEGGQVMTESSDYYGLLRRWIGAGAKVNLDSPRVAKIEIFPHNPVVQQIGERQQVRIVATYADGKTRDVTSETFVESGNTEIAKTDKKGLVLTIRRGEAPILARFEGSYAATTVTIMGDRSGFVWEAPPVNNEIDRLVAAKLQRTKTAPSAICGDLDFVRRLYLDLTGLPPTPDDIRSFLADPRDSRWKRDLLVEKLVGSESFLEHWTNKWCDLLQVNSKFLAREGAEAFRTWIRREVAANTPYDHFARKVLTATGSTKETPPANYYKILRKPEETMENTTHLWLATRFNCNKCHDHPFERWTQDQYYQMSAFFARTGLDRDPASGDRNIGGTAVEGATPLYEFVVNRKDGETKHLRTGAVAPPTFPYPVPSEEKPDATRRDRLATWITSPDNPYFAKSYVNRLWGYLLGTGIIEPLDDIRAGNPPSNPELLDWLTRDFIANHFDTRHLIRTICQSRTYQLSLKTSKWNEDDTINFSHAKARRLPAEVLFDTIYAASGSKSKLPGMPEGTRAAAVADPEIKTADGFLGNLGKPSRESACECERSGELQLGPVMALISGPTVGDAISDPNNAIAALVRDITDDRALIDELFLRFLGRPANAVEAKAATDLLGTMDRQHSGLAISLQEYETDQQPVFARREQEHQARILAIKSEKSQYEGELAPRLAEMEKQRAEKIAAAQTTVTTADAALGGKLAAWEEQQKGKTGWLTLEAKELKSSFDKTVFEKQPDGSVFVSGPDKKQSYTILAGTSLVSLTGLRLEALTDDRVGGKGPGRSGQGNFVLSEMEAFWLPVPGLDGKPAGPQPIKFTDASATYSQQGYEVKSAIDGKAGGEPNGWAIHPGGIGKPQTALFLTGQPVPLSPGGTLKIVFKQQYPDGKHSLGRFRLSLTNDPGALNFGLSKEVTDVLAITPNQRTPEQTAVLLAHLRSTDPDLTARRSELAEAQKPLPPDPKLEEIKARLARAEVPLPLDAKLAQYRRDVQLSTQQQSNKRLIAAQDLAWALINNPAFLFNR